MQTSLIAYLHAFVIAFWPQFLAHGYQVREAKAVVADIASTDATPQEALRLANIAALESGFRRDAKGPAGECGAFQVMPPYRSCDAREALYRMRVHGMVSYVGCRHAEDRVVIQGHPTTCAEMIAHRVDRADLWLMAFDLPRVEEPLVAGNP